MKTLSIALIALLQLLTLACTSETGDTPRAAPATVLVAHATQRAPFRIVGADTLSDSTRITGIFPEQDGDGLAILFADPGRGVSAGLALIDRQMTTPQLVWPDSITRVWWTGPHMLAFATKTGEGIRLVVDIHAAKLSVADTAATGVARPPEPATPDESVTLRARAYVDSIHPQPAGQSPQSTLVYSVTRVVPSPDGTMAAFHSIARDTRGGLMNPSWFALDRTTGSVVSLDRITGSANELPENTGEWSGNASFFYAKGLAVWEAEIQRSPATP